MKSKSDHIIDLAWCKNEACLDSIQVVDTENCTPLILKAEKTKSFGLAILVITDQVEIHHFTISKKKQHQKYHKQLIP